MGSKKNRGGTKDAEAALRRLDQEKEIILDSILEHIVYQDMTSKVLWTNRAAAESVGSTPEQLVGRHCYEIWHQRSKPCEGCPVVKASKTGKPQEKEVTTPDGRAWFIRGYPIQNEKGKLVGAVEVTLEITERKKAEEALQESDDRMRLLLESAEDIIIMQDLKGRYLYYNAPLKYGLKAGDVVGKTPFDIHDQETATQIMERIKRVAETGKSLTDEEQVSWKGEMLWSITQLSPVKDASGNVIAVTTMLLNITERKKAEETLRESEERYRNIIEGAYDMVQSVKPDGTFDFVNRAWMETMGYTEAELPSLNLFDIIHPDSLSHCQEIFSQVIAGNAVTNVQATFVAKDGRPVFVDGNAAPRHLEGKLIATHGFFRDITERKKAEEALKEAYGIINRSPAAAFLWKNAEGWPVEFVSENVKGLFGHSAEDFTSGKMSYAETVHPDDLDRVAEEVRRFSEEKGRTDFTHEPYRIVTKEGEVKWVYDITHIRRDQEGSISHYEGIVYDITDRKKAEEKLEQKMEELEKMNRLMVGRELRMIELKEQIKELKERAK